MVLLFAGQSEVGRSVSEHMLSTRALLTNWHLAFATVSLPARLCLRLRQYLSVCACVRLRQCVALFSTSSFLNAFLEFVSNLSVIQPLLSPSARANGLWTSARWPETSDQGGCVGSARNTGSKGTLRPRLLLIALAYRQEDRRE